MRRKPFESKFSQNNPIVLIIGLLLLGCAIAQGDSSIRIAVIGDRTAGEVPGIFGPVVEQASRLRPDFVLHVGDIIDETIDDSVAIMGHWQELDSLFSPITAPVYGPAGNNDIWNDYSEQMYRHRYGNPYRSVDQMGIHIILLDNSRWEFDDFLSEQAEQVNWLIDDLEKNQSARYTLVLMHKPFWYDGIAENKPDSLHSLFVKYGVDAVFTGHYHEYFSGEYDGIKYTGVGSSGGGTQMSPTGLMYHFVWVTIDDEGIHIVPIKKDAILTWDNITAEERKIFRPLRNRGLAFANQPMVGENMTVAGSRVGAIIDNSLSPVTFDDTVRWEIPDGWSVEPAEMPVMVAGRATDTVFFEVACDGHLFPAPSAEANFNYAENKTVTAERQLYPARLAVCNPAEKKIKIDGELKEKCWQNGETGLFGRGGGASDAEPAEFYFAYDKDNLYLAAKCTDNMIDSMSSVADKRDGPVYRDDCVGYFIAPDFVLDTFYQIYFNPSGIAYDVQYWLDENGFLGGSLEWNGEYEIKSKRHDDFWVIEIKIPLKQFGLTMEQGRKMRLNFRRKQPRLGNADWQTPIEYDPHTYGHLIMR